MTELEKATQALGRAMAAKGIPPFMLATNIKEPNYRSVNLWKESDGTVRVQTVCTDEEDGEMKFLYTYDKDTILQRIDAEIAGRTSIYYDRRTELQELRAAYQAAKAQGSANAKVAVTLDIRATQAAPISGPLIFRTV